MLESFDETAEEGGTSYQSSADMGVAFKAGYVREHSLGCETNIA